MTNFIIIIIILIIIQSLNRKRNCLCPKCASSCISQRFLPSDRKRI